MKKNIKKNGIKIFKKIDENNLGSIARILLSSFVLILFFYSLPLIINFADEKILNTKEFKNNSKVILAYTLDKENNENSNEIYDEISTIIDSKKFFDPIHIKIFDIIEKLISIEKKMLTPKKIAIDNKKTIKLVIIFILLE